MGRVNKIMTLNNGAALGIWGIKGKKRWRGSPFSSLAGIPPSKHIQVKDEPQASQVGNKGGTLRSSDQEGAGVEDRGGPGHSMCEAPAF